MGLEGSERMNSFAIRKKHFGQLKNGQFFIWGNVVGKKVFQRIDDETAYREDHVMCIFAEKALVYPERTK